LGIFELQFAGDPCSAISATKNIQHTVATPSFHPTGFATSGEISWHGSAHFKRAWICVRQMRPPGRGEFWILKIAHAPSPKNLSKNGFCPRKGVAFLTEGAFEKKFSGAGEDSAVGAMSLNVTAPKPWLMMVAEPALITVLAPGQRESLTSMLSTTAERRRCRS
jgi:hypothetical protein